MRRSGIALALLACATASSAVAAPVRIFAVGHKQQVSDAVSYQSYENKMAALMDAAFPGRSGLVQAGVDDIASHLAPVDPSAPANALVVLASTNDAVQRAARNLPHVKVLLVGGLNVYDVLKHATLIMTRDALEQLAQRLGEAA